MACGISQSFGASFNDLRSPPHLPSARAFRRRVSQVHPYPWPRICRVPQQPANSLGKEGYSMAHSAVRGVSKSYSIGGKRVVSRGFPWGAFSKVFRPFQVSESRNFCLSRPYSLFATNPSRSPRKFSAYSAVQSLRLSTRRNAAEGRSCISSPLRHRFRCQLIGVLKHSSLAVEHSWRRLSKELLRASPLMSLAAVAIRGMYW